MKETSSDGVEKAYSIRCLILKAPKGKTAEMLVFSCKAEAGSRERDGMGTGSQERDMRRAAEPSQNGGQKHTRPGEANL